MADTENVMIKITIDTYRCKKLLKLATILAKLRCYWLSLKVAKLAIKQIGLGVGNRKMQRGQFTLNVGKIYE